ncbi:MSHA biogenesis protein MshI [Sulfurirhabdus autotrophica]|uniref:MSHA biogenesis protein MshI n=1 Tax=Sulfurirhabdus autotrophica TaxID=1706046 RepID=A0A4R3Y1Q3_9PROT|nr:MSHA biogenesis protein MshI [Sulfurirhabdus autotrophica]TCV85221.1 hypothetical protein EDC63_110110 [Sulfurirhabdus autotrophica]
MSQQINLFNPVFLKQEKYFSATTMVQALGLIVVGVLCIAGYVGFQSYKLQKQGIETSNQLALAQSQLAKVNAEFGPRQKNQALEQELRDAEAELLSLQEVSDILENGELGNTKGYSEYLRAFSRQVVSGLWLTGFSIYGAGNEIGVQGRVLQPALVPAYIARLKREQVMQGKSFSALEMSVPMVDKANKEDVAGAAKQEPAGFIEFNLRSSGIKENEALAGAKRS